MLDRIRKAIQGLNALIKTPFYLFDELFLEQNYHVLHSMMEKANCNFSIAYSIKTNPLAAVVSKAMNCGALAEVTSMSELQIADQCGFEGIIFNGIYKTDEEIVYAAKLGATIVLDGYHQISRMSKIAATIDRKIRVGLRISSYPILNDNGSRFGVLATAPELKQVTRELLSVRNIDLHCLHMHIGTYIKDAGIYRLVLDSLYKVSVMLESIGVHISLYDLGGGMPSYIDTNWQQTFCDGIKSFQDLISDPNRTLLIEAGRALVESAGFLVTRVVDVRARVDGRGEDVIVDVGTNSVMGANYGVTHQCFGIPSCNAGNGYKYRLVGPLCHAEDIIMEAYESGSPLEIGDMLLIAGVGAYDFSTAYEFSRGLPRVYFLDVQGQFKQVR